MFNYFKRQHALIHILHILRIDYGMNTYPHLTFKHTLDDDLLTLELPSINEYTLSPFEEKVTIIFNKKTEEIKVFPELYGVEKKRKLRNHLRKCVKYLQKRDDFTMMVHEERKKMAKLIDPRHRTNRHGRKNEDYGFYREPMHAAADDSDSSDSHHSNDNHSNHHDN